LGSGRDLAAVGARLFAALRELDGRAVDVILVHGFGHEGLGAAIWDRLLRAAEGKVIDAE
jgi:L-threonylcarbamoyladenylate synthase